MTSRSRALSRSRPGSVAGSSAGAGAGPAAAKASSTKPASRGVKTPAPSGPPRREDDVAGGHAGDGGPKVRPRDRLRDVAAGAGADHRDDVLRGVGHRQ